MPTIIDKRSFIKNLFSLCAMSFVPISVMLGGRKLSMREKFRRMIRNASPALRKQLSSGAWKWDHIYEKELGGDVWVLYQMK